MKSPCSVYPPMVARQRLGKHIPAATNSYYPCRIKYLLCDPFYLPHLFSFITPSFLHLLNVKTGFSPRFSILVGRKISRSVGKLLLAFASKIVLCFGPVMTHDQFLFVPREFMCFEIGSLLDKKRSWSPE
jgi:hypothetical protein